MGNELDGIGVVELRKRVRAEYPQCRGAFASQASREDCLAILTRQKDARDVIRAWHAQWTGGDIPTVEDVKSATASTGEPPDELPEGVAGDILPVAPAGVWCDLHIMANRIAREAAGADKILAAVRTLNPSAAAYFDRLIEADKSRLAETDRTTSIVASGGKVAIGGVDVPVILKAPQKGVEGPSEAAWADVPALDKHYRFDIWSASRKCGAVMFRQSSADLFKLLLAGSKILLVGPPACGKTSIFLQLAARCGWPTTRFNGNRDVTMQDFVGTYEAKDGSTAWLDGPLPKAMKAGHILILDEVDHMPAECSSVMHSVMEPGGKLVLTVKGGEVISPHPNFRVVATANTAGFGDDSGLHPNAQVQDFAFLSRFDCVFRVAWMGADDERDLLVKSTGIRKADADLIVRIASDTRRASENGDLMYPVTLRQTLAWAQTSQVCELATGFALAVLNKMPDQDVAAVAEIAQRHFGDKLGGSLADAPVAREAEAAVNTATARKRRRTQNP